LRAEKFLGLKKAGDDMLQKTEQKDSLIATAAEVLGDAALAVCWGILDYCGILDAGRIGSNVKERCMQIINDEVQS
jgi:hypothetical protein